MQRMTMTKEERLAQREELLKKVSYAHFLIAGGRATVVGYEKDGELKYAIALCAPGDQFVRREGRKIALARLIEYERGNQNNAFRLFGTLSNNSFGLSITARLRKALVQHLSEHCLDDETPSWIKRFESEMKLYRCSFEGCIAGPNGKQWSRYDSLR